ncbi:MAG: hypothetical protein AAF533_06860 [Acidobacteriota bacterium]
MRGSFIVVACSLSVAAAAQPVSVDLELTAEVEGPSRNFHFIGLPLIPDLEDVGDERGFPHPPCRSLDPAGFEGDGVITLGDLVCTLWSDLPTLPDPTGGEYFSVQVINEDDCSFTAQVLARSVLGTVFVAASGQVLEPPVDYGFLAQVTQATPSRNAVTLFGDHDPSYPGRSFPDAEDCGRSLISIPYDSLYRSSHDIFCGVEGVDWDDGDGDGNPDSCEVGIYPDDPAAGPYVLMVYRSDSALWEVAVVTRWNGILLFPTPPLELRRGEAYLLQWSTGRPNDLVVPTE